MVEVEKKLVKCPKCGYSWQTKSKMLYITCVNCQRKFERKKRKIEED